jgi:hypothetical protein
LIAGSSAELRFLFSCCPDEVELDAVAICENIGAICASGFVTGLRFLTDDFGEPDLFTGLSSISMISRSEGGSLEGEPDFGFCSRLLAGVSMMDNAVQIRDWGKR